MTKLFQLHRPTPAHAPNAFERVHDRSPTVFATTLELGRAKAHQSMTMTDQGQAAIAASHKRAAVLARKPGTR